MYERFLKRRVEEALADTPVVLIVGPRRAGKTTLVRQMEEAGRLETIRMLPLATHRDRRHDTALSGTSVRGKAAKRSGSGGRRKTRSTGPARWLSGSERLRQDSARAYLTSLLTRDLRDIANIEKLAELPKFVRLLAEHSGSWPITRSSATGWPLRPCPPCGDERAHNPPKQMI